LNDQGELYSLGEMSELTDLVIPGCALGFGLLAGYAFLAG